MNMLRTFETHQIRKTTELSSSLWDFQTLPEEGEAFQGKIMVPGCWETSPETRSYRGKARYGRTVFCGGSVRFEFKGVSHTAQVYLDGKEIARHYNAYTPFDAVAEQLPVGEHRLEVYVDNSFGPQSALHVPNDYQTYGGITRPVAMEQLGEAYLSRLFFTPVYREGKWYASARAEVRNLAEAPFAGKVEFYLDRKPFCAGSGALQASPLASVQTEAEGRGSFEAASGEALFDGAQAWSLEEPVLYFLTAVLFNEKGEAIDDLTDRVGFREIRIEGKDILLNGKRIRIKGFCRHEDHPQFGCSLPLEAMQQDLLLIREMGGNSVRTSHYPNDERFLDLCDELGILVWEENHARGLSEENMRNPHFEQQCEDCIREMIENHYNHPSIYIWGILNECASHTEYGRECYQKQLDLIRQLDPVRPRSFASCQFKTDICLDLPEVVSYNIYPQWYHDTPAKDYLSDLYEWVQKESGGGEKPFLVTEVGAGAVYGYRTPDRVKWSEEYQAEALERQLEAVFAQEGCCGVYIWQFCDCRVCGSWFANRPRTMNNKGIVDEYRRPKLAWETVKRIFTGLGNEREQRG